MNKIFSAVDYLLERLSAGPPTGGLEVSDSTLRFLRLAGQKTVTFSLRLPPGVISEGKILGRNALLAALQNLHNQIIKNPKTVVPVIVSLPPESVYTQVFSIPELGEEQIAEAAELNLQMISPIEQLETAYYSWQKLGRRQPGENQLDILGAFVNRALVDDLNGVLKEVRFYPAAFEFPALALARVFKNLGSQPEGLFLAINVTSDGLDFLIVRNGNLYFSYFRSWRSIQGESRQIKIAEFQNAIQQEVQKVINFAAGHWPDPIKGVSLISQGFEKEIIEVIQNKFNLKTFPFRISKYPYLTPPWFGVLGSAWRGLIPRSRDEFISLAKTGAEQEFYQNQALSFVSLWRNIIAGSLGILIIAFLIADLILLRISNNLENQLSLITGRPENEEVIRLRNQALKFNRSVTLIKNVKEQVKDWSPFLKKLTQLTGKQIVIEKLSVPSLTAPIGLSGRAVSERAAIDFKNVLAAQPQFTAVNLPLAGITPAGSGFVSFNLSFVIKDLNF